MTSLLLWGLLGCGASLYGEAPVLGERQGWSSGSLSGISAELYRPAAAAPSPQGRGLMVVLHGCSQAASTLRNGADWGGVAEAFGMVVVLPQARGFLGCWDYYGPSHSRSSGDSGDLLRFVDALQQVQALGIDPDQTYVAGLSAGGGMSMVLGCLAPDVFAGVGIAAGPTVGTNAFQTMSVSTSEAAAVADCSALAGANAPSFATQVASAIIGDRDIIVAQGYTPLNTDVFATIYSSNGTQLSTSPLDVTALQGHQPRGSGQIWSDAHGERVSLIEATGMGHAWPAGTGPGAEINFIASEGVDYGWYLASFFSANNRRVDGALPPVDTEPTDTGETLPTLDTGTPGTIDSAGPGDTGCVSYVRVETDDLNGHLPRYDVYPSGYGVADATYVALLGTYGVGGAFDLYLGHDGDWYHDPANAPSGPGDCGP